MISRRGFLGTLVGGVAVAAAARTFPFRVYSFPSEIKIARDYYTIQWPYYGRDFSYVQDTPEVWDAVIPVRFRATRPDFWSRK